MRVSAQHKLNAVKFILEGKSTVTSESKLLGVSRKTIYLWLKKYKQTPSRLKSKALDYKYKAGVGHPKAKSAFVEKLIRRLIVSHPEWGCRKISKYLNKKGIDVGYFAINYYLKSLSLAKPDLRINNKRLWQGPGRLSSDIKLSIVKQALASDKSINSLASEYKISRKTIYEWIKLYNEALKEGGVGLQIFNDKYLSGINHPRSLSENIEKEILDIVTIHPELSIHQLSKLSQVSSFTVWKILSKHSLSNYQSRLIFASKKQEEFLPVFPTRTTEAQYRTRWEAFTPNLAPAPPPSNHTKRFLFKHFIGLFATSFISCLVIIFILNIYIQTPGILNKIGTTFAFIALAFGMFFFIYSLKYYLTIFIILSRSRLEPGSESKRLSLIERLFGIEISIQSNEANPQRIDKSSKTGLTFDLSNVSLERLPFVSIHIATFNEKRVIERLLTAATSMDYPSYEVVIADDSTDETVELIEKWRHHPRVKISRRDSRDGYKGGALKQALNITDQRSEFILVLDADFIPYPDTITQFLKYFQYTAGGLSPVVSRQSLGDKHLTASDQRPTTKDYSSNIAAVQGYQWHVLNKSENWITRGVRSEYAGSYVIERSGTEVYGGLKQISGSVYMIRRDVLQSIGWGTSITEDFELTLRLYEKGFKVVYTPYVQTPAEAVSTLKRLVRQRMRWAEGHSYNVKRMFWRLMRGHWVGESDIAKERGFKIQDLRFKNEDKQTHNAAILKSYFLNHKSNTTGDKHTWIPSPLTLVEKLELIYLTPYYLQAAFFIIGTISWLISETIFQVRLPFWTEVWGWSLVLTNLFALPLMNLVGLFMEESEERDYAGLLSFVALSYIVAPFQAYAAIKGFIEESEGPWFRTPKTGRITDIFTPGRFTRFFSGLFGKPQPTGVVASVSKVISNQLTTRDQRLMTIPNLSQPISKNILSTLKMRRRTRRWVGNTAVVVSILVSMFIGYLTPLVPQSKVTAQQTAKPIVASGSKPVTLKKETISSQVAVDFGTSQVIFHKEPRVRFKESNYEVEIETLSVNKKPINQSNEAFKEGLLVTYPQIHKDSDLLYRVRDTVTHESLLVKKYSDISSITQRVRLVDLVLASGKDGEIWLAPKAGGQTIFKFDKPYMYEENNPSEKSFALEYIVEKKNDREYTITKQLTSEGKQWLSDSERQFPVVIDPSISNIIAAGTTAVDDAKYGSNQRKVAYMPNATGGAAWYAFHADNSGNRKIRYQKCAASSLCDADGDWSAAVAVDVNDDVGDGGPNIAVEGDTIYVAWIDDVTAGTDACCTAIDAIQFRALDTTSDTFGSQCSSADLGSLDSSAYTYIAVGDNGDILVGQSSTSGDTEADIFQWESGSNCATGPGTGFTSIEASSGLPTGSTTMRPVALGLGNLVHVVYDDAANEIRHSIFDLADGTDAWSNTDTVADNGNVTDDIFSVTTDGSSLWLLYRDTATTTVLQKCASPCTTTWSNLTSPWASGLTTPSYPNLTYFSTDTMLRACIFDGASSSSLDVVCKDTNSGSISWGSQFAIGFSATAYSELSTVLTVPLTTAEQFALVVHDRTNSNLKFATVPEYTLLLLIFLPVLPKLLRKLKRKSRR